MTNGVSVESQLGEVLTDSEKETAKNVLVIFQFLVDFQVQQTSLVPKIYDAVAACLVLLKGVQLDEKQSALAESLTDEVQTHQDHIVAGMCLQELKATNLVRLTSTLQDYQRLIFWLPKGKDQEWKAQVFMALKKVFTEMKFQYLIPLSSILQEYTRASVISQEQENELIQIYGSKATQ